MIVNLTYSDNENKRKINRLVGPPFSFFQRLKMGGNGSPKLSLSDADDHVSTLMNRDNNRNVCNIELRPKGIIIGFRSRLDPYALVMPYQSLKISRPLPLHYHIADGKNFVLVKIREKDSEVKKFILRIEAAQQRFLASF